METVEAERVSNESSYNSSSNSQSNSYDPKLYALMAWAVFPLSSAYFILDKKYANDDYLMFHAYQSLAAGLIIWIIAFVPILQFLMWLFQLVGVIVWLVGMFKAYEGERFKLPIIGDWAEQQVAKAKKS